MFNIPNFHGVIEAGTPLVQVIPIKRSTIIKSFESRAMTLKEVGELNLTRRKVLSHQSFYRDTLWEKK